MTTLPLFRPYEGHVRIEPIASLTPQIVLSWEVLRDTLHFLALAQGLELSWVGRVTVDPEGDAPTYHITEIRLLPQTSTFGNTILHPAAVAAAAEEWMEASGGTENPCRFWGHTHPFPSTDPSERDDAQMLEFIRGRLTPPFLIRGIFSPDTPRGACPTKPWRSGVLPFGAPSLPTSRADFSIYDYHRGIVYRDVPWMVTDPERHAALAVHVASMVSTPPGKPSRAADVPPHAHTEETDLPLGKGAHPYANTE